MGRFRGGGLKRKIIFKILLRIGLFVGLSLLTGGLGSLPALLGL